MLTILGRDGDDDGGGGLASVAVTKIELPAQLAQRPWDVREAGPYGLSWERTANPELHRPFHGVRSTSVPATPLERASAYFARQRPGQLLVGPSSAALWGLPLPTRLRERALREIFVAVAETRPRPRARGVVGRRLREDLLESKTLHGIPAGSPLLTYLTLATMLTLTERIVIGDALLASPERYPGLEMASGALVTRDDLLAYPARVGAATGSRALREAVPLLRDHVDSPWETIMRRVIVDAGLPEPRVAHRIVRGDGTLAAVLDLAYVEARIDLEIDGRQHAADPHQWRRDMERTRELQSGGWLVIRATARDLAPDPGPFVRHVRSALAERAPRPAHS